MSFAQKLKELRIDRGLSQYQLAEKIDISQSAIAKWELSKTEPTLSAIIKIANFFNVTTDYLLEQEEKNYINPTIQKSSETRNTPKNEINEIYNNLNFIHKNMLLGYAKKLYEVETQFKEPAETIIKNIELEEKN